MEDEKGLDLNLALPCGGSSSNLNSKYGSSSDLKSDEGDRGSKLINEFKNFLEGGTQQHPLKSEDNFYTNFSKASTDLETSKNSNTGGGRAVWLTNDDRSIEGEEERRPPICGEKRKNQPDLTDKSRASHISINTDDGSAAENEDVADSEVEVVASGSFSRAQKEIDPYNDPSNNVEPLRQKRFSISSDNKKFSYGVSFPAQPVKDSNPSANPALSSYPLPGMVQPVVPAHFPLMFGYNPVQIPVLDKDNSRGVASHHQQIQSTYSGRNQENLDVQKLAQATSIPVISHKPSEFTPYDTRASEHGKSNGKQHHFVEEGSYSHTNHQGKDSESFPSEYTAIRPGILADLKFGGCGTYPPNLPWVSTTGPGPNGRKISGVTYRYSPTQIKIVCACHGSHMSPEEFVRHASEENCTHESGADVANSNPAASAPQR